MTQRTSFAKMQRDRDKQAKAAAKRDRRQERQADPGGVADPSDAALMTDTDDVSPEELLTLVERVHRQFEGGTIDFETFEETKLALLKRLPVD